MHIDDTSHPQLCKALRTLIHDNGGNTIFNPDQNQPNGFEVPKKFDQYVDQAEIELAKLNETQFELLVGGEESERLEFIESNLNLKGADIILDSCFENYNAGKWEDNL